MSEETRSKSGTYLYALLSGSENRRYGPLGINGGEVYTIANGEVAAVVSDVLSDRIRPERRHLAAHQKVLKHLMRRGAILPMRFGIIASGRKAIREILSRNRDALLPQLRRVEGKIEMGLRVTWDTTNIFEYFVNTHPELHMARDRLLGTHREPTQEEKIELGRMFDRILNEDRDLHTEEVESILSRYCSEIKRNRCRDECEVMNLACLVPRDAQGRFESGVFEVAALFDNNFAFDYNGPWAPHNFAEIDLKL